MKIYYASDLHCDYNQTNRMFAWDGDKTATLILAGDIYGKGKAAQQIDQIADRWKRVLWVPGNHDWWGLALHEWHKHIAESSNVFLLEGPAQEFDGVQFVGATGWTHIRTADQFDWRNTMNDPKYIRAPGYHRLNYTHINERHFKDVTDIKAAIKTLDSSKPSVLVTHHPFTKESIAAKFAGSQSNKYYVENRPDLIEPFDFYIHGHVHSTFDYDLDGTRVLCNPSGYGNEVPDFELKYFEV